MTWGRWQKALRLITHSMIEMKICFIMFVLKKQCKFMKILKKGKIKSGNRFATFKNQRFHRLLTTLSAGRIHLENHQY